MTRYVSISLALLLFLIWGMAPGHAAVDQSNGRTIVGFSYHLQVVETPAFRLEPCHLESWVIRETKGDQTIDLYPLYDGTGHVIALADSSGTLQAEYAYGPFGELIHAKGPHAQSNPFRYATKYFDVETGLYYFGKRYLDPVTGQWMSREPLGEDESVNLYSYCHNDPINGVDVLGLRQISVNEQRRINELANGDAEKGGRLLAAAAALVHLSAEYKKDTSAYVLAKKLEDLGNSSGLIGERELLGKQLLTCARFVPMIGGGTSQMGETSDRLFGYNAFMKKDDQCHLTTRAGGLLMLVGGTLEATGGVAAITGSGVAEGASVGLSTPVSVMGVMGGTFMVAQGADYAITGAETLWTGEHAIPAGEALLQYWGMSPSAASWTYGALGIAVSAGTSWAATSSNAANTAPGVTKGPVPTAMTEAPIVEDTVSLFHQGTLRGGQVSSTRGLSTSLSSDLSHYRLGGQLYEFKVPRSIYEQWRYEGLAVPKTDLHWPTGIVTPEIRIMPPASGSLNQYLVCPPGS